jgi:hypothetical protein
MRNVQTFFCFVLVVGFGFSSTADDSTNQTASTVANWTPPQNPDPMKILAEARADTAAGQYANALAKFVWFQQDTAKAEPLAFALPDWTNLDAVYPRALEKLKAIRDEAEKNVHDKDLRAFDNFLDFEEINEVFGENEKTKELFIWLDSNKLGVARSVFDVAEPALINAKEFRLCGNYIHGDTSFAENLESYRRDMQLAKEPRFGKRLQEYAEKNFINETTTLIALLVVNDRKAEAKQVADNISKEPNLPDFKAEIQKALNGEIPPRWP